ncbi:MAG: DNA primase [Acetobacteraceae bacterium]|nr:DNA primase [Acetobacteraceae bacterium]
MPLPAQFLDELRTRTPLAAVIDRKTKLVRAGRQWRACCPFHGEKTPSLYVYDDHFHCFGCGAHGDAISFVMQSDGAGFIEAVERLAAEAGMAVPKPVADADERRRLDLHGVLEAACTSFARRLLAPEGRAARDYLHGRGLTDEAIREYGLGWAGEGRGALGAELAAEGIGPDLLVQAGLMRAAEEGGRPVDLFFKRITFPIRDARGRLISFGGRALGDGQPKYVNGPETTLFSKRRSLYGIERAGKAVRSGVPVIVVEGYMDVIALGRAGFGGAVAPLGTALTEEQLAALWRLSPNPVLCFDGDAAGARAAGRAAELALPLLAPGRTLSLVALPNGDDPDSLLGREGTAAFRSRLAAARPLADALFDLLRDNAGALETPEQRAALLARLDSAAGSIADRGLAAEYRRTLRDRFFEERRQRDRPTPRRQLPPRPVPSVQNVSAEQARILTAILLNHPDLLHDVEQAYAELALPDDLARLRDAVLGHAEAVEPLDSPALLAHLSAVGLAAEAARALSALPFPLPGCAQPGAMPAEAEAGWWHIFGLMHRNRLDDEVAAARRQFDRLGDGASHRRFLALCATRDALRRGEERDDA